MAEPVTQIEDLSAATLALLSALAHETRLDMFRLLVRTGNKGLPAGDIAARLGLPAATCSFHLKELKLGGVLSARRAGRSLIYTVNFAEMQSILGYLLADCCIESTSDGDSQNACTTCP